MMTPPTLNVMVEESSAFSNVQSKELLTVFFFLHVEQEADGW